MKSSYSILLPLVTAVSGADVASNLGLGESDVGYNYNYIGTGLWTAGLTLTVVILVLSIGSAFWVKYYQKEEAVCASQPIFLWLICAGTALMGAAIVPLSIDDEIATYKGCDIACQSIPFLFCLGLGLVSSSLVSKFWRVSILFNHPLHIRKVTALDVSKPLAAILLGNILVLSLWNGLDPLLWVREEISPGESIGRCRSNGALPYVITLGLVNLASLALAFYHAWNIRNVSAMFSESRHVSMAIVCTISACVVP